MIASWSESAKRRRISSRMGAPVHMDLPKSSRTMPANPRAVRDDPVPLERVEIVRFLVEKPLLELAHEPLALLRVDRPTLPGVQLVEHAVGVAPVVVVAHARGLELVEVEIRLDHEPALGVHGHLEVPAPVVGHPLRGLEDFLTHGESHAPPLVDA